jgi:hypothetical protein
MLLLTLMLVFNLISNPKAIFNHLPFSPSLVYFTTMPSTTD